MIRIHLTTKEFLASRNVKSNGIFTTLKCRSHRCNCPSTGDCDSGYSSDSACGIGSTTAIERIVVLLTADTRLGNDEVVPKSHRVIPSDNRKAINRSADFPEFLGETYQFDGYRFNVNTFLKEVMSALDSDDVDSNVMAKFVAFMDELDHDIVDFGIACNHSNLIFNAIALGHPQHLFSQSETNLASKLVSSFSAHCLFIFESCCCIIHFYGLTPFRGCNDIFVRPLVNQSSYTCLNPAVWGDGN
jgi:hypothetical protein